MATSSAGSLTGWHKTMEGSKKRLQDWDEFLQNTRPSLCFVFLYFHVIFMGLLFFPFFGSPMDKRAIWLMDKQANKVIIIRGINEGGMDRGRDSVHDKNVNIMEFGHILVSLLSFSPKSSDLH
jgi:hypothetical protein